MFASLMPDLIAIDAGPAQAIKLAARAGFAGIDMRLNKHAEEVERLREDSLADAIAAAGLRPGYCSLTPQKINVPDREWTTAMRDVPRRARIGSVLGYTRATSVVVPFAEDMSEAEYRAMHVRRVRQAADVVGEHGFSFGLEYVSPKTRWAGKPNPFVRTLASMLDLLDEVNRPNVGVMLDCFHWHCAGETADDIRKLRPEQVVAVHVNDLIAGRPVDEQTVMERELPRPDGVIDIAAFLGALADIGYDGPITAEPTNPRWREADAEIAAKQTADAIRACLACAGVAAPQTP